MDLVGANLPSRVWDNDEGRARLPFFFVSKKRLSWFQIDRSANFSTRYPSKKLPAPQAPTAKTTVEQADRRSAQTNWSWRVITGERPHCGERATIMTRLKKTLFSTADRWLSTGYPAAASARSGNREAVVALC